MGRLIGWLAGLVLSLPLVGCGESHSWRQKTIIEVETPNGIVSGGNVLDVSVQFYADWETSLANQTGSSSGSRGESSVVEVMPGKYLVALTASTTWSASSSALIAAANGGRIKTTADRTALAELLEAGMPPHNLPQTEWPLLVTFDDVSDPKSIRVIEGKDLSPVFGDGFSIMGISIQTGPTLESDSAITEIFPWLCQYLGKGLQLNGTIGGTPGLAEASNWISAGYIKTGKCK